jgi:uncharacterized protein YndB with AHSA1/START domain
MAVAPVSRRIDAPPAAVCNALTDSRAVSHWRAPDGMTATVHTFDVREGGAFRISLTHVDASLAGKTAGSVDTCHGHFRELVPERRVVEVIEFESSNPELTGESTVPTSLEGVDGQTEVTIAFEGLQEGEVETLSESTRTGHRGSHL